MSEPTIRRPAPRPCASCPYRRDTPSGVWAAEEYAKLPAYDADTPFQPTGVFRCHQQDEHDHGRVCAGWAGCHRAEHLLALRLAVPLGTMSLAEVEATRGYRSPVPLFGSGAEAAAHGLARVELPEPEAAEAIRKIRRVRSDLR